MTLEVKKAHREGLVEISAEVDQHLERTRITLESSNESWCPPVLSHLEDMRHKAIEKDDVRKR